MPGGSRDGRLHVLVANNIYPPIMAGGAELIVSYLCEGLAARGHRVTVVSTCGPEAEPYPVEHRNGVEVIRFFPRNVYWSFARGRQPPLRKAMWHLRDAWNRDAGRRFNAVLEDSRPDLLNTHLIDGFSASIWGRARRRGLPVLHTAHDYHLICPRAFLMTRDWRLCTDPTLACRGYRAWHLGTTRNLDVFASPSQFLLDKHVQAGLPVARRRVLHNGIPQPADVAAVRAGRDAGSRRRFLLMCRLTVEKGVRTVLEALRLRPDLDIELMVAGKGALEDEVAAAAALDPRIRMLGYLSGQAKRDALSRAGFLLLPSLWYENAPVVIVEAAAYGLGLIGSRIGGIPEFVRDGETGLLFPPGDAAALAGIMERLVHDPALLPDPGGRAAALAEAFTVDRMVDAYETAFQELVHDRAATNAA